MATKNNISLDQGEQFQKTVTYNSSNDVAVDMTGYTYELKVAESWTGNAVIFTLTGGSGIDTTNESIGQLTYTFSGAQTALLTKPQYQYQLKVTDTASTDFIIEEGHIFPDPSI